MHDDLLFFKKNLSPLFFCFFFVFENERMILLVPERGDKAWPNAPSLKHEYMTLKNLDVINSLAFSFLKIVM